MSSKSKLIRLIYLYLFSVIGLVLVIISGVRFIDMGLKTWVFTKADNYSYEYERIPTPAKEDVESEFVEPTKEEKQALQKERTTQQRQRDAASALAQLAIGLPLYLYHWRMASKRKDEDD